MRVQTVVARNGVRELSVVVAAVYAALIYVAWTLPTDVFWAVSLLGVALVYAGLVLGIATCKD